MHVVHATELNFGDIVQPAFSSKFSEEKGVVAFKSKVAITIEFGEQKEIGYYSLNNPKNCFLLLKKGEIYL